MNIGDTVYLIQTTMPVNGNTAIVHIEERRVVSFDNKRKGKLCLVGGWPPGRVEFVPRSECIADREEAMRQQNDLADQLRAAGQAVVVPEGLGISGGKG